MAVLFLLPITFAILALSVVWRGYAFSVLWGWFIIPYFGVAALSIPVAIGLTMVVSFLTYQFIHTVDERSTSEKVTEGVVLGFLHPAFALLFGWIVTYFL